MEKLQTLFLDAGGVLVYPSWERASTALEQEGIQVPASRLAAAEPHAKRAMDVPTDGTSDASRGWLYFSQILTHCGVAVGPASEAALARLREYHARHNLWEHVPVEVVPALKRLRTLGLRLVVVSNSNGTLCAHLERLGLAAHFDHMLDSHDAGFEKPDPRLFQVALERAGARAESTLHVGDLYHVDVVGARAAGLRAALLDVGDLYADFDCPRVGSLLALADAIQAGAL